MIEPIIFDLTLSGNELKELWQLATLYGTLISLSAWASSFIIHTAFGFLQDIIH